MALRLGTEVSARCVIIVHFQVGLTELVVPSQLHGIKIPSLWGLVNYDDDFVALGTLDPADSSVTHASDSAAHVRGGTRLFIPSTFHLSCSDFITRPSAANSRIASRLTPVNYILGGQLLFTRTKFFGRFFVFAALFFFDCMCYYNVATWYKVSPVSPK